MRLRKFVERIIFVVLGAMLCTGCRTDPPAACPPETPVAGSGYYRAEIDGRSVAGSFRQDGLSVSIRPDCAACAPICWVFDGACFTVTSGRATFTVPPTVFPAGSALRVIAALQTADWRWTAEDAGWCGSTVADGTIVRIRTDASGKIFRLSIPDSAAEISLEYPENNAVSIPAAA